MSPTLITAGAIYRRRQLASGIRRVISGTLLFPSLAAILVTFGGCGGKDRLAVSPVRGQVVYKGLGVPQAIVIFNPVEPADEMAKKMRPFAYADGEGRFEIKTYVDGDGAPPGKYRVSIIAPAGPPTRGSKDRPADAPLPVAGTPVRIPPMVIKKYANVETAGLEVDIQEGENNLQPFVLKM